jgi:hypothetical protein
MKTIFLLAVIASFAALSGCSPEPEPAASNSSAYMFAIEPCESSYASVTVKWLVLGPMSDGTNVKVRVAYHPTDPNGPYTHTLTAQTVPPTGPVTTNCWDRFPNQVPEEYVSDSMNPPGTSGYYQGKYIQVKYDDFYGPYGIINNNNDVPVAWARFAAYVWNGSSFVWHRWLLNASNVYSWVQEY